MHAAAANGANSDPARDAGPGWKLAEAGGNNLDSSLGPGDSLVQQPRFSTPRGGSAAESAGLARTLVPPIGTAVMLPVIRPGFCFRPNFSPTSLGDSF